MLIAFFIFSPGLLTEAAGEKRESEPNNESNEANEVSSGVVTLGQISGFDDEDWYRLDVQKEGTVKVLLENLIFNHEITLYDKNLSYIAKSDHYFDPKMGTRSLEGNVYVPGTYYLKITASNDSGRDYRLKVTYPSKNVKHDSSFEPNDTKENGYGVQSGKIYYSKIETAYDVDYYKLDVKKPGEIRVWLDELPYDYDLYLYNENGMEVGKNLQSGQRAELIEYVAKEAGTYYAMVKSNRGEYSSKSNYAFKATYPATVKQNSALEPNDTKETSTALSSGKEYKAKIESAKDVDVYKLKVEKAGQIRVNVYHLPFMSYDFTLKDDKGNELRQKWFKGEKAGYLDYEARKAGTYYVYVKSPLDEFSKKHSYTIKATFPTKKFAHNKKTLESNDTREWAYPLKSGKTYKEFIHAPTDEDFYKITLKKNEKLSVALSELVYDYDLVIQDHKGNDLRVVTKWAKNKMKKEIHFQAPYGGTYFVKVYSPYDKYSTSKAYKLYSVKHQYYQPLVNDVLKNSTYVSGKAEPNMKVYVKVGSKVIGTTTTYHDGSFSVKIPKQKAKTKLSVYTVDSKKKVSPVNQIIVK